jgi:prepilin peptidase CpaA
MAVSAHAALWFLPFVLPICFYVAFTDLALMKITNKAFVALVAVFVVLGPFVLPSFELYFWRLGQLVFVLLAGILLNAAGAMGAGDAKFMAAAAPFIAADDWRLLLVLFIVILIAAVITHRLARVTPLRKLAPDWVSWSQGKRFPMGLALGPTLALYLCLGALNGA